MAHADAEQGPGCVGGEVGLEVADGGPTHLRVPGPIAEEHPINTCSKREADLSPPASEHLPPLPPSFTSPSPPPLPPPPLTLLSTEVVVPGHQSDAGPSAGQAAQLVVLHSTVHRKDGESATRIEDTGNLEEGGREGREEGREGGREEGRKGGREGGREEREGGREHVSTTEGTEERGIATIWSSSSFSADTHTHTESHQ